MKCALITREKVLISRDFSFGKGSMPGYGGQMKKIIIIVIIFLFLSSVKAFAEEGVDGVWVGEGAHAVFELVLRRHQTEVFGTLNFKVKNSHRWDSYHIINGVHTKKEISLVVVSRGCEGEDGRGITTINGVFKSEDTIKATLTQNPPCVSKEEIIFHKE